MQLLKQSLKMFVTIKKLEKMSAISIRHEMWNDICRIILMHSRYLNETVFLALFAQEKDAALLLAMKSSLVDRTRAFA